MTARRLPLPILLLVVLIVAAVAGDPDSPGARRSPEPVAAAVEASAGTLSTAWFCPGPPTPLALDTEVVTLANIGDQMRRATVTVYPDDSSPPATTDVELAPNAVESLARPALGPPGGVVVEAFSPDVVVESGFLSADLLASNPCASTSARNWYFAAGTTVRGVEQYVTIFNPLGSDAKVDVTLRTEQGELEVESVEALDVPRRSRVVVQARELLAARTEQVAIDVHATVGRVVAEQTLVFAAESTFSGVTRTLGAVTPSSAWTFADGSTAAGTATTLVLSNPSAMPATAEVFASVGSDVAVFPVEVTVAREGVARVTLGGCADPPPDDCLAVPPDRPYTVAVETSADTPVVAEVLAHYNASELGSGSAALVGSARPTERWIVPRVGVAGATAVLSIANPDIRAVTVDVEVHHGGSVERPDELQGLEVEANQRFGIDLTGVVEPDAALVVTASDPVVVERSLAATGDQSRTAAIPGRR